jgi:hypothetical protein
MGNPRSQRRYKQYKPWEVLGKSIDGGMVQLCPAIDGMAEDLDFHGFSQARSGWQLSTSTVGGEGTT